MDFVHNKKFTPEELKQALLACDENFSHPKWGGKIR